MKLIVFPATLNLANDLVDRLHRHHEPARGHRFSIGLRTVAWDVVGAAIVGRPVARGTNFHEVIEVTRLVTDGTKNACSMLYSRAAKIAQEMGFLKIQTFILEQESGVSLRASGWVFDGISDGGDWNSKARTGRRRDQPTTPKQRWKKDLN